MNGTITRTRTRTTKPATEPPTEPGTLLAELEAEYTTLEATKTALESKLRAFGHVGATKLEREDAQQALKICLLDMEAKGHALNGAREAAHTAKLEEEAARARYAAQIEGEALDNLREELDHGYTSLAAKLDAMLEQVGNLETLTRSQAAKLGALASHTLSRGKHEVSAKKWATLQSKIMAVAYRLLSNSLVQVRVVPEHPDASKARGHALGMGRQVASVSGLTPLVDVN